jgi:hypothetical protein
VTTRTGGPGAWIATATLIAACSFGIASAHAQDRPPPPGGPSMAEHGKPGMGGPGMRDHGMMMHMMSRPTMTATDKYVYILRGDTLYQFSADGLKLLGKAELPRPEPRAHHERKPPPGK